MDEGLNDLLAPLVASCDGAIRGAIASQEKLRARIDAAAAEVARLEAVGGAVALEPYTKKLVRSRRRVAALNRTLSSISQRLLLCQSRAERKLAAVDVPLPPALEAEAKAARAAAAAAAAAAAEAEAAAATAAAEEAAAEAEEAVAAAVADEAGSSGGEAGDAGEAAAAEGGAESAE
eukprot:PLAT13636.1.p2 GENE.PLAT13636.1~~PLAT13636.1.p2  ORF type:complete len:186 (+),score=101.67 PLAT13636.1:29-559(+)